MKPISPASISAFKRNYNEDSAATCWNWMGRVDHAGRGKFGRRFGYSAPRFAYALAYGVDPAKNHVLHSCDNAKCVNPAHLSLGTHLQNMRHMRDRGRQSNQKLNLMQVRVIRHLGDLSCSYVAKLFGCGASNICNIRSGYSWKQ